MAKMFYRFDETKTILRSTDEQLRQLTREGKLREFRDGVNIMYKSDQVDRLAETIAPTTNSDPLLDESLTMFRYSAMNSSGQDVNGVVEARTNEEAVRKIREKGLFPTRVRFADEVAQMKADTRQLMESFQMPQKMPSPSSSLVWRAFKAAIYFMAGMVVGFGLALVLTT